MSFHQDLVETAGDLYDAFLGVSPIAELARITAAGFRGECLQVRLPGIPFGEHIARGAAWWADQAAGFLTPVADPVRREHERITTDLQEFLGIPNRGFVEFETKPRFAGFTGPPNDGFLVEVPGWQDIFKFNNEFVFDQRSRRARALDYADSLRRSPTPPSFTEIAQVLTTLDDIQDEAAALTTVLAVVERVGGRRIPGLGQIALVADALDLVSAVARPGTLSSLPGTGGKRRVLDKVRTTRKGYAARVEEARRFRQLDQRAQGRVGRRLPQARAPRGDFRVGAGDLLQGLQATESLFGVGIQLGPVVGFLQDAFWGGVRGATFQAAGPIWDPLGFTEAGQRACTRSPDVALVNPRAYYYLANEALSLWSKAGRVMPWIDVLGEHALASVLVGLRAAENVLGPWLRKGEWVELLGEMLQADPVVAGGVEAIGSKGLRASEFIQGTLGGTVAGLGRAISNVPDRGRQSFYESLSSSIAWGFLGDLEPGVVLREIGLVGPGRDAFLLAEANQIPRFDLED